MNIVVLDGYTLNPGDNPWDAIAALGNLTVYDRSEPSEIVDRARDAEIVLTNKTVVNAEAIAQLPKLRFIGVLATGYNVVDIEAARQRGIPVTNVPEYSTDSVAQHVFAMLLTMCHHPALHDQAIRDGEWQRTGEFCFWKTPLTELADLTLGIVGFGRIGRRVGELAHAFGMKVLAHTRTPKDPPTYEPFGWVSQEQLFAESDVVSLHCPLTDQNAEMINQSLLAKMKPSAVLVNVSRGGLVNEQDLADALNAGKLAGACLDVFQQEPIDPKSPLLEAKNCLMTPHIAWATLSARRRLMGTVAENIAAFQKGEPIHVVNGV